MELTYRLESNGYIIMDNGVDWIDQTEYIPLQYKTENIEDSAKFHIRDLMNGSIESKIARLEEENIELKIKNEQLEIALAETLEKQEQDKTEIQLVIAQLIETNGGVA